MRRNASLQGNPVSACRSKLRRCCQHWQCILYFGCRVHAEVVLQTLRAFFPTPKQGATLQLAGGAKDGNYMAPPRAITLRLFYDYGTVFKLTSAAELTTLFSFNGTNGGSPAGLTPGDGGCFYGVTGVGGTPIPCQSTRRHGV